MDLADLDAGAARRRRRHRKTLIGLSAAGLALAGGLTLVAQQIPQLGPAIRAAHGEGTRGGFTLQQYGCGRFSCTWTGVFVVGKGRLTLHDAAFNGDIASRARRGVTVPALYTGDPGTVYPVTGSNAWIADVALLAFEVLAIALVSGIAGYVGWVRRDLRHLRDPMTPAEREALRRRQASFRRRVDRRLQRQRNRQSPDGHGRHTAR